MKIKSLIVAFIASAVFAGAIAQTGAETGTRFGHGNDSITCRQNISLMISYASQKNYKDAEEFWTKAYRDCPAATKDIYLYGIQILEWKLNKEKDPAKREDLINQIMKVYDDRVKYFGDSKRYGKNYIISMKANDYIRLMGNKVDYKLVYSWLKEIVDEYKEGTNLTGLALYPFASLNLMLKDSTLKSQYINDYTTVSKYFDAQIAHANKTNNTRLLKGLEQSKNNVDIAFANSGAADCETLEKVFAKQVEEKKNDLDFLQSTLRLFRRIGCTETDTYFAASEASHKIKPTSESAIGIAKQNIKKKDFDKALEYYENAISLSESNDEKADCYYTSALLLYDMRNYSKARLYCNKALEYKPNFGSPLLLIGQMYGATAKNIYPDDDTLRKTVYYLAVDKFARAKSIDPSCAEQANKLIYQYSALFPSTEDIFMHPNLKKGQSITIGGWIGESTVVR